MKKLKKLAISIAIFIALAYYYYHYVYKDFKLRNYKVKDSKLADSSYNSLQTEFILHSKCYCHKEYIHVKYVNDLYVITVKDFEETYFYNYNITKSKFESLLLTCNLFNTLRQGPNQKVISYTYSNSDQYFLNNLRDLLSFVKKNFINWRIRVYHDSSLDQSIICEKQCLKDKHNNLFDNIDFCNINQIPFGINNVWNGDYMLPKTWRWLPIGDDFVDLFISRDTDSCLLEREVAAVNEWLQTSALFHVMRDHPSHSKVMLGGLWGLKLKYNRKIARMILNAITDDFLSYWLTSYNNGDEELLRRYVWPLAKHVGLVAHDSYFCEKFPQGVFPFPTQRKSNCYVGSNTCCNTVVEDIKLSQCPYACRSNISKEWLYC